MEIFYAKAPDVCAIYLNEMGGFISAVSYAKDNDTFYQLISLQKLFHVQSVEEVVYFCSMGIRMFINIELFYSL